MFEKLNQSAQRAATLGRIAVAARSAARKTGDEKEVARRALAALMADARGVPMKVGQFLAGSGEEDPFAALTRGVDPVPFEEIRVEVERALGAPLDDVFEAFDPTGIAASLGQVHRARLKSGEEVAVKVRYPGIVAAVEAEMRLARLVPGLGPVRTWGFELDAYKRVLSENMRTELDYRAELGRQQAFAARMNVSGLVIPRVYPEFSRESLLVQSWEEGVGIDALRDWSAADRKHVGLILMCTLFQSLFVHGEIHGDPHIGNYRYRRDATGMPEVVLMDYGCTIPVSDRARQALLKLILGAIDNDATDPLCCFVAMGFDGAKLQGIVKVLPALSRLLLEPFVLDAPFKLQHWNLRKRIDVLLGDLKWWFRSAGPANLLLMLRAFRGLMIQLETLNVALPWKTVLFRVVDSARCAEARALQFPQVEGTGLCSFTSLAQVLRVRVSEHGRQVMAVSFPACEALLLEELIPEDTLARIAAAGFDLAEIKARVCASGLHPQELFDIEVEGRSFRVWLE